MTADKLEKLDMEKLLNRSSDRAQALLFNLMKDQEPYEALIVTMLATAVMARSMDMPREILLEGVGAAFNSLQEVGPNAVH
jgi:hypothetical protein